MSLGVLVALIQTNLHLRLQHRNIGKVLAIQNKAAEELYAWQKCLDSVVNKNNCGQLDFLKAILTHKIDMLQRSKPIFTPSHGDRKSFEATLSQLKKLVRFW